MEVVRGRLKHAALVETTKGCYACQQRVCRARNLISDSVHTRTSIKTRTSIVLYSHFGFGTTGLG